MGIFDFLTGGSMPTGSATAQPTGMTGGGIGDILNKALMTNTNMLGLTGLGLMTARTAEDQQKALMNGYFLGSARDSAARKEEREEAEKKRKEAQANAFKEAMARVAPQYADAIRSGDTETATALIRMARDQSNADRSHSLDERRYSLEERRLQAAENKPFEASAPLVQRQPDGSYKPVYTPPAAPEKPIAVPEGSTLYKSDGTPIPMAGRDPNQPTQRDFDREAKLRSDFEKEVGVFPKLDRHYRTVQTLASKPGATGYDDIGLVFNFMKMFDPDSAVLPGEYATAATAGNVKENIVALYNKVLTGEKLTEEQRAKMLSAAKSTYDTAATQYEGRRGQFEQTAKDYGLNPDRVLPKYARPTETTVQSTAPSDNPIVQEAIKRSEKNPELRKSLIKMGIIPPDGPKPSATEIFRR